MRTIATVALALSAALAVYACSDKNPDMPHGEHACDNGIDDDMDGTVDFPEDLGCISGDDESEDSATMAQCNDGRDNDGDGIIDYPNEPGCFAPQQDDEIDDCPTGPNCPQCSDKMDNDANGMTDFPADPGCTNASDTDEFTHNPQACGQTVVIEQLPGNNMAHGPFMAGGASQLMSTTCGGMGPEAVYELRITDPKVLVATTDNAGTTIDTILYLRGQECTPNVEMACNDDISGSQPSSSITASLLPGVYYLVVDSADNSTGGEFELKVQFFVGEGVACQSGDDCGPGLVCRVPVGDTVKKCSLHVCSDGVDDDADTKLDFPDDPGCSDPLDDDETDMCPGVGPNCPECGDGFDNDGDGMTDFPADTNCQSASSTAEACHSSEPVALITAAATPFTTTGQTNDFVPACGSSISTAPDLAFRLDVPAMQSLTVNLTAPFDTVHEILDATCGGVALRCSDPVTMPALANLAAGTYYVVVDGYSTTAAGSGTINVSGQIAAGASCEGALATSGVITCAAGFACKGTAGARICGPALCNDNVDNDGDGKKDYPQDPGCDSPADDTEVDTCPGAGCPVCSDTLDNDTDTLTDYPMDFGCAAASGTTEVFCTPEHDPATLITMGTTMGTTAGNANDFLPTCQTNSSAPDHTWALNLPVPVVELVLDTTGSAFDTVLTVMDAACGAVISCNDDGATASLRSKITLNNVAPGNYAVVVDGYTSNNGLVTFTTKGTVATGTVCTSPLFAGGVLLCPAGTTCNGGTCH